MIPKEAMEECREKARSQFGNKNPKNWITGLIIVLIWRLAIYAVIKLIL
jgi:hypothetical protein